VRVLGEGTTLDWKPIGASTVRWRDVDLRGRLIHVCRQYTHDAMVEHGKTDAANRDIGIDAKLATELTALKLQQKP
jgi:hypothetical protein